MLTTTGVMGLKVMGIDIVNAKLEEIEDQGSDYVFNSVTDKDYVKNIKGRTGGGVVATVNFAASNRHMMAARRSSSTSKASLTFSEKADRANNCQTRGVDAYGRQNPTAAARAGCARQCHVHGQGQRLEQRNQLQHAAGHRVQRQAQHQASLSLQLGGAIEDDRDEASRARPSAGRPLRLSLLGVRVGWGRRAHEVEDRGV